MEIISIVEALKNLMTSIYYSVVIFNFLFKEASTNSRQSQVNRSNIAISKLCK